MDNRQLQREGLQWLALCLAALLGGLLFGVVALLAHEYMTVGRVLALFVLSVFVAAYFVSLGSE